MAAPLVIVTCSLGAAWETEFVRAAAHPALGVHVGARCAEPGQALGVAMRDAPFAVVADGVPGWWDLETVHRLAACGTALVVVGGPAPPGGVAAEHDTPEAIAGALLRLEPGASVEAPVSPAIDAPAGQLVAVWGGSGSPGRTTVAIHLAAAAARIRSDVLLVDGDVWAPSVAQRLGLHDGRGLVHAARGADDVALEGATARLGSMEVLPGLGRAELWPEVGEAASGALLDRIRRRFGLAVVDLAHPIEEDEALSFDHVPFRRNLLTRMVLERADRIILVVAGDPIGLRRGIGARDALVCELPGASAPLEVVVNRVPATRVREVGAAIGTHLGLPVAATIGIDRSADTALWRGCLTSEVGGRSSIWSATCDVAGRWVA
ncbi:MAG: CpaE family protein [Actinomycetes bacterium]